MRLSTSWMCAWAACAALEHVGACACARASGWQAGEYMVKCIKCGEGVCDKLLSLKSYVVNVCPNILSRNRLA